ncbi:hypothetical protein [Sulfurisoma sediminicola]|uniref:hypothetical protein n=1 Tax=Sulfurisoma sediminicola TaxID=1381557 RepID=UPI000EAF8434|nr:hypothetical protein [Sulfurisoma sediminicola]
MHLDSYPHITHRIESLWGTKECRNFLLELISDSRDGKRQGLPPDVAKEIILVLQHHDAEFPGFDDSAEFVKMSYQFMPREVPVAAAANEGVVLKLLARISAYGVALVLAIETLRKIV